MRHNLESPSRVPGEGGAVAPGCNTKTRCHGCRDYSILDSLLEGCQIIGFDWRYIYVNDAAAKHGRTTRDALLGHTMMEMYPGIEHTPMFAALRRCMDERAPSRIENHFAYTDGASGWFALKIQPVPEGAFILSIDISGRKRAEEELEGQLQRLQALREIDIAIAGTTDLSVALKTVLDQVTGRLHVDAADILLLDPHSQMLGFAAGRGFRSRAIERGQLRLGQGHAGRVALERRMLLIPDLADCHEQFMRSSLVAGEDFASFCCTPLIAKGKVIGVLEVFHRALLAPDQNWFDFLAAVAGQASIAIDNSRLFNELQRTNIDLVLAYDTTIEGWSRALDLRDDETEGHTLRVTEMTLKLACMAGIPEAEMVHIKRGALLHDIGKMGIPDAILLKPSKLSEEEWVIMRKHPTYAYEWLSQIQYLSAALDIPYCHHERWDGTGYPRGLRGKQIPLAARLFATVDVWDALSHDRPYRGAWPEEQVLEHIRMRTGTHFDPEAAELFLHVASARAERDASIETRYLPIGV
jgi:PAS domain S-box-containing protein